MATGPTVSHEVPLINLSDRPKLPMFTSFPAQSGKFINIVQRIGANYLLLGIHLLNDETGSITQSIISSDPKSPTNIILNILSCWLQGGGRRPVTWVTFINVLTQIGLLELTKELCFKGSHHEDPQSPQLTAIPGSAVSSPSVPPGSRLATSFSVNCMLV
ncbi:hypothetical protein GBAR_LOCUS12490 [Geodia barretti]|uniref:Uncharacterized protein n=1 Tax=Geodia barretti TaxID=519541 RepID=A0AA35S1M2_GEOBA|nr:hypothetical protein GBAR_LOCUS12490 [Geodia barretti]